MPKEKSDSSAMGEKRAASAPDLPGDLAKELGEPATEAVVETPSAPGGKPDNSKKVSGKAFDAGPGLEPEPAIINNKKTDEAVDEVLVRESDELLAMQDAAAREHQNAEPERPRGLGAKFKVFFAAWWRNKWARWTSIILLATATGVAAAIPGSRYFVLNAAGVRGGASLIVLDRTTQLPLKNVEVSIGAEHTQTNVDGLAKFSGLRLGPQDVVIKRAAFAPSTKRVIIGWGSNPLGTFDLKPVGRQYVILLSDHVSGKPVTTAEASHGGISALADEKGKITLTAEDNNNLKDLEVTISAKEYRSEKLTLRADNLGTSKMVLVPSRQAVFVGKQSGKQDVYAMDLDGKNKKLLLGGTGRENNNTALAVSADGSQAALVSTRDEKRDQDGFLLSTLALIDIGRGTVTVLDHAVQIQLVDWIGSRIVYQSASSGASASSPQRYRIFSYDYKSNSRSQLAAANQFNAVLSAQGSIYYANSATEPGAKLGFFRVKPNGSGRQRLLEQEVWSAFRVSYDSFDLQTPGTWYSYNISNSTVNKIGPSAASASRPYLDSPDSAYSAWVDNRDGKGMILVRGGDGKDAAIHRQEGLTLPIRWLTNRTLIYRLANGRETADYAVSLDGGSVKKISEVANSYGFSGSF